MNGTIIITGAASGIGAATARRLAKGHNNRLYLVDRNASLLEELTHSLGSQCAAVSRVGDLADPDFCDMIAGQCVDAFGQITGFISNAGVTKGAALAQLSLEDYDRLFAINTRPTFLIARSAYPYLRENGGSIVATASISANHPTAPLGSHAASKAALVMLVRQMALEWGPDGIRANCVSPGPTLTPLAAGYANPAIRAERSATIPLRKIGSAEDVANAIAFLMSPDAGHISGQNIEVDGGLGTALMALSGSGKNQPQRG